MATDAELESRNELNQDSIDDQSVEADLPEQIEIESTKASNASEQALGDSIADAKSTDEANADASINGEQADNGEQSEPLMNEAMVNLKNENDELIAQLAQKEEEILRVQADAQNLHRRTQKDIESTRKFAVERFAEDLLPVMDGLQRGIESIPEDDRAQQVAREGMALSLKNFEDALTKHGIVEINPVDQPFNPEHHQAMSTQSVEGLASNQVINVFQKGYLINDRVLRPALVSVSK